MDTKKTFHWDVIPQYVIGRLGYHNCLVHEMNANRAVDTIDGSLSVHAVHQTVQDGNRAEHTVKGLEIKIGICEGMYTCMCTHTCTCTCVQVCTTHV